MIKIEEITQEDYDALEVKDPNTLYRILSAEEILKRKQGDRTMSREKQIEEMASIVCHQYNGGKCLVYGKCEDNCFFREDYKRLYNAGYRKQEWISVDERLPESSDIECLLYLDNGQIAIGWYHVSAGAFVEGGIAVLNIVTHWMPLPEAPKMEGGAE